MSYFIAERNTATGKFELWHKGGEPYPMNDDEALESLKLAISLLGKKNIILLKEVSCDVKVEATFNPNTE